MSRGTLRTEESLWRCEALILYGQGFCLCIGLSFGF